MSVLRKIIAARRQALGAIRVLRLVVAVLSISVTITALPVATWRATAAGDEAGGRDLDGAHYTIAVHLSDDGRRGEPQAIREFVAYRVRAINAAGGIEGRRLVARFFDDADDETKTKANIAAALADPRLVAQIGLWSSSRGATVVDQIGASGVPFITEMSVETLFEDFENVYSMAHSVRDEVDVMVDLARHKSFSRIAYVGLRDDRFVESYHRYLRESPQAPEIVATFWEDADTTIADYDEAIARIGDLEPQMVVLALGSKLGARFLGRMHAQGLAIPAFVSYGNIRSLIGHGEGAGDYAGDLFEVSTGGVANVNNERIERLTRELGLKRGVGEAAGVRYTPRELGYGARYADLVQLLADAANGSLMPWGSAAPEAAGAGEEAGKIRARIAAGLASLREGHRYWEGRAQYWTFTDDRSTSERAMLLWKAPGQRQPILNPTQFISIDGGMREVPVLSLHLDMVRMFEVDTNARRFDAEFYLTLRSHADLGFEAIDFTNAFRSDIAADPIRWREVARYPDEDGDGRGTRRIYHVTGRFAFEPDLAKYPFDEQLLTISFQPADAQKVFILQPPGEALRRKDFRVEDWKLVSHYVGTTDRIITSIRGARLDEHAVPYYNFNYTWVMRREVIDYLVRVIVPLSFILIVAYLSAFIPRHEFNATIAIQVTALLSAIALYFALNQPNSDEVTLSDKIFVSAYAIVSLMIALSIFEVVEGSEAEGRTAARGERTTTLRATQIFVVPVLTLLVIGWLIASAATDRSIAEGVRELVRWGLLAFSDLVHG